MNPVIAILSALALVALGAGLSSLAAHRRRWTAGLTDRRRRVLLEDALKHLHDVEYRGVTGSVESLAGALEVPGDVAVWVVTAMESERLIERQGAALRLTEDGRSHARRMVRIHRLWEKWLAEETGVAKTEWHALAEKREHRTSDEEAERLSAQLGHPAWDPHGDPIPTATGEMPPARGIPLPDLGENEWAVVVHVEDEPAALYQEIVQTGLHPGSRLVRGEASGSRVCITADGIECELSPVAAANVTVSRLPSDSAAPVEFETLTALRPGGSARVVGILPACLGAQRRRLLDLGLVPGTLVTAVMTSASGDPTAFRIRGSLIALRTAQTRWVRIEQMAAEGVDSHRLREARS